MTSHIDYVWSWVVRLVILGLILELSVNGERLLALGGVAILWAQLLWSRRASRRLADQIMHAERLRARP
jgi:hypothetical protein